MRFERLRDRREFRNGPNVPATSRRLACDDLLLRHLVHLSQGWIPRVPCYDVKVLLGIHVHEDAMFVTAVRDRLADLGGGAIMSGKPGPELRRILDFLESLETWEEYIGVVYSVIKPGLVDAWEKHYTTTDPLLDEPTARLMADLMRVAAQHIAGGMSLVESLYAEPGIDVGALHETNARMRDLWSELAGWLEVADVSEKVPAPETSWKLMKPVSTVARDEFIKVDSNGAGEDTGKLVHQLLNDELQRAEVLAESSHANPTLPWGFHRDMARLTWDQMRHAMVLEKVLARAGIKWGDYQVDLSLSKSLLALPLDKRLESLGQQAVMCSREGSLCHLERIDGIGELNPFLLCRYFRADDYAFQKRCQRWAKETSLKG